MAKHPAEVFGHPIEEDSEEARRDRKRHWCPFVNERCDKKSRLLRYPMGVCSVRYGNDVIALSPSRFREDDIVFRNIADHYFGACSNIVILKEVNLQGIGNFDFVMVKHKPLSLKVEDFVIVELQTAQTTSTGKLVKALKDYTKGEDIGDRTYAFGLNHADIWKRTFTQILNKGIVIENWNAKIYWVVQEPIYADFLDRYRLTEMSYAEDHSIRFAIYDLKQVDNKYHLSQTRIESSTTKDLFSAFSSNPDIPPKDAFLEKLSVKLQEKAYSDLQISNR